MLSVSARRLARKSLKFAKIDEAWRSGGRKTTSTTSGSGGYYWQKFYSPDDSLNVDPTRYSPIRWRNGQAPGVSERAGNGLRYPEERPEASEEESGALT